jgi:hypothetical protein
MTGTTPSEPPTGDPAAPTGTPFAPPDGDLMFPAPADGAWQRGNGSGSQHRWVVVLAAVVTVVVLAVAVLVGLRVLTDATAAPPEAGPTGSAASISELGVGACYRLGDEDRTADSVGDVSIVDCSSPHDGQVYATVPLDYDDYPGDAELSTAGDAGCAAKDAVALDPAVGSEDTISPSWYAPLEADWHDSEHVATCVIEADTADGLTRSWTTGAAA